MTLKINVWHRVFEYCPDCSNSDLGLTLIFGKVKYRKMLEHKISRTALKIFILDCSNEYLRLTLSFSVAKPNLLSWLLHEKRSWIL